MSNTTRTCALLLDLHDLSACQLVKHAAAAAVAAAVVGIGVDNAGSALRWRWSGIESLVSNGHAWHGHRIELHRIADMVGQHLSTLGRVNVAGSYAYWTTGLSCPVCLVSSGLVGPHTLWVVLYCQMRSVVSPYEVLALQPYCRRMDQTLRP